ncbi:MAG TPA: hypothetical protein PLS70_00835 [Acidobacteriota bacterium]|nr:hypothetical protein [Acidobacteriota bacterium]
MNQPETSGRKLIQFLACAMALSFCLEFCSGLDLTQPFGSSAQLQVAAVEIPVSASNIEALTPDSPTKIESSAVAASPQRKAKSTEKPACKPAKQPEVPLEPGADQIALVHTRTETELLKNIIQVAVSENTSEVALAKCVTHYALAKCATELAGTERVKAIKALKAAEILIQTASPEFSKTLSTKSIKALAPLMKVKTTKC